MTAEHPLDPAIELVIGGMDLVAYTTPDHPRLEALDLHPINSRPQQQIHMQQHILHGKIRRRTYRRE